MTSWASVRCFLDVVFIFTHFTQTHTFHLLSITIIQNNSCKLWLIHQCLSDCHTYLFYCPAKDSRCSPLMKRSLRCYFQNNLQLYKLATLLSKAHSMAVWWETLSSTWSLLDKIHSECTLTLHIHSVKLDRQWTYKIFNAWKKTFSRHTWDLRPVMEL